MGTESTQDVFNYRGCCNFYEEATFYVKSGRGDPQISNNGKHAFLRSFHVYIQEHETCCFH